MRDMLLQQPMGIEQNLLGHRDYFRPRRTAVVGIRYTVAGDTAWRFGTHVEEGPRNGEESRHRLAQLVFTEIARERDCCTDRERIDKGFLAGVPHFSRHSRKVGHFLVSASIHIRPALRLSIPCLLK